MDARGRLCVGIDPHASLLAAWGLDDDVAGLDRFAMTVVDALGEHAAVLKPQSAFFERFGSRGTAVLERATARAREAGALVLTDAKRGDIGSTMAAYAATYLDPASPLFTDAVTVSPYLGFESLRPALDMARAAGAGVFVLALTSNPEGAQVQRASGADGRSVAQTVLDAIAAENARDAAALAGGAADAAPVPGTADRPWAPWAPWWARRWPRPTRGCPSAARCSPRASARREPPRRTCRRSSARRCRTCCRASAGTCCGTVRTWRGCGMRPAGMRKRSPRRSMTAGNAGESSGKKGAGFNNLAPRQGNPFRYVLNIPSDCPRVDADQDFSSVLADLGRRDR